MNDQLALADVVMARLDGHDPPALLVRPTRPIGNALSPTAVILAQLSGQPCACCATGRWIAPPEDICRSGSRPACVANVTATGSCYGRPRRRSPASTRLGGLLSFGAR